MTPAQARSIIEETLAGIAPDADVAGLPPGADLRDTLALDSLDFLRFIEVLSERTSCRIDEDDYPRLATLGGAIEYLAGR